MSSASQQPLSTAIGIDFGGTSVKLGIVRGGELVRRAAPLPTLQFRNADDLLAAILSTIEALRAEDPAIAAVGAGLPGIVDSRRGIVHHLTNVPGWDNVPLRDVLHQRTGLPAAIENDAKAMTYAEWKFGAAQGRTNVVCVALGTGVGGGLILDGRLYRGSQMGAGEIGNMSIDYRGVPGKYGNFGALEQYVGHRQIAARAVQQYAAAGHARELADCTLQALAANAEAGDEVAKAIWEETGTMLGTALADVVWLVNPDVFVIGGGVAQSGELIFGPVRRAIRARTSAVLHEHLELVPAKLGPDAGLIGCGALALDESFRVTDAGV